MARLPHPRVASSEAVVASSSATDATNAQQRQAQRDAQQEEKEKQMAVSPELRDLLSRKVVKLDVKTIKDHGGGIN